MGPMWSRWTNLSGPHLGGPCRAQVTAHQKPTWGPHGHVGWVHTEMRSSISVNETIQNENK
ncbi:hypothetical protein PO909_000623 [Leuciscus waleckii]